MVLVSTLLTLAYFVRIFERMYFTEAGQDGAETRSSHADEAGQAAQEPAEEVSGENLSAEDSSVDSGPGTDHPLTGSSDAPVSPGMIAFIVVATLTAVALGFAVPAIQSVLEPTMTEVLGL